MLLRVAIVDDLALDREALQKDLEAIAQGRCQLACARFASGDDLLARFASGAFDLIFMDICMEGTSGIDAARAVRRLDPHCLIVFLTTSADYAWQSFPVHPFDYLIKPCAAGRLEGVLTEALRALDTREPEIELRVSRRTMRLPLSKICYAVAQDHQVSIVTRDGEHRCSTTFSELQRALLQDERFLLCNRGVIINMDAVHQFDDAYIRMMNGAQFPIRQRSKTQLFNAFTQYQFRHMKKGEPQ